MSLKAWRTAIADAVATGLGVTVSPWNAPTIDPPCAIIDPGEPYLTLADDDETTFDMHTARWSVWLLVRDAAEEEDLDELDDLIDALAAAVRSTVPPEQGSTVALERVETPLRLQVGGTDYLATRCTVNVLRPT